MRFHFPWVLLPAVNFSLNILHGKYQNKEFISFQLHAIPSTVMKSRAVPLCPTQDVNPPFAHCL